MQRRAFLRSGFAVVTGAIGPIPQGLTEPPFLDLDDAGDLDRLDARLDAIRAAVRVQGRPAFQEELAGLARRAATTIDRTAPAHDLYQRLCWVGFYAVYMAFHGFLERRDWWTARAWAGKAAILAARAKDDEMNLLALCGVAATRSFAGLPTSALGDLRVLGWEHRENGEQLPPSPLNLTLLVEAFTAYGELGRGTETRRLVEDALEMAQRLDDEPPGRVVTRPAIDNVLAWGGFALARSRDGAELTEAEKMLRTLLGQSLGRRNWLAAVEARSALAVVLAKRGDIGEAIDHIAAGYEPARRLGSARSLYRLREAIDLIPSGDREQAFLHRIQDRDQGQDQGQDRRLAEVDGQG